ADQDEGVGAGDLDRVGAVAAGGAGDDDGGAGGELVADRGDLDLGADRRLARDQPGAGPGAAVGVGAAECAGHLEGVVGGVGDGELAGGPGDAAEVGQGDLVAVGQAVAAAGDGQGAGGDDDRLGRAEAGVARDDGDLPGGRAVADDELVAAVAVEV